jgi:DNA polymerase-3 subunit epsilon
LLEAIRHSMSRSQAILTLSTEEKSLLLTLFPGGIVAVDLETTGLSPLVDKIIEIAAVKLLPSGHLETFHQLVNPLIEIPKFTFQFHGLTNEDVKYSPTIKKPLKLFWDFVERLPITAHNSTFDLGYLIKASHDFQLSFPPLDVYDSCRFARAIYKGKEISPPNFKLSTLAHHFAFELKHHVAIEDTFACLKIMAAAMAQNASTSEALKKSFVFRLSHFDKNECFNFSTRLKDLPGLVQQKDLLQLDYKGSSPSERKRPIRPIGLMPLPTGPVLFAECLLTGMNKSFILKKIKSFHKLEASLWRQEQE